MESASIDWTAVLGIVGTILGTVIGAFATYKVQERQLRHADATRFQEHRMQIYAEFTGACNSTVSAAATGGQTLGPSQDMVRAYETIRLVASDAVFAAAGRPQEIVGWITGASQPRSAFEKHENAFNQAMADFVLAARSELHDPT